MALGTSAMIARWASHTVNLRLVTSEHKGIPHSGTPVENGVAEYAERGSEPLTDCKLSLLEWAQKWLLPECDEGVLKTWKQPAVRARVQAWHALLECVTRRTRQDASMSAGITHCSQPPLCGLLAEGLHTFLQAVGWTDGRDVTADLTIIDLGYSEKGLPDLCQAMNLVSATADGHHQVRNGADK